MAQGSHYPKIPVLRPNQASGKKTAIEPPAVIIFPEHFRTTEDSRPYLKTRVPSHSTLLTSRHAATKHYTRAMGRASARLFLCSSLCARRSHRFGLPAAR